MAVRVGFIGAGKVGCTLGKLFAQEGVCVSGYASRHEASAAAAARFTGSKSYQSADELVLDSDAVFLTVPDAEIPSLFQKIKALDLAGKAVCHCSGALTVAEALPGIEATGAFGYCLHPLFPVSDRFDSYREVPGALFCLEGTGPHLAFWEQVLRGLGCPTRVLAPESKARYHAACAISSNLVCALVEESLELLSDCGFSRDEALAALAPLVRSNVEHLLSDGPVAALTGPVERNDVATVRGHLACLPSPEDRALYRAASQKLVCLAEEKNPGRNYQELKELLSEGERNA